MTSELKKQSIESLASLLQDRKISPVELANSILNQISQYNKILNAYIDVYKTEVIEKAETAEREIMRGNYRGPLHGIPIGIKDNLFTKNKVTTMGSYIHRDFKPGYSATVVNRLEAAGTIITGKLNMHEYALGITSNNPHYGPVRNPWDITKISGGSSGGSSVSVSANMAAASIGSDTGGSIRIPSAACGVVGLKPTYGRISKYGCFPEAWTLDHVGPITQTVDDASLLLRMLEGFDANDPTSIEVSDECQVDSFTKDIKDLVIGVNESFYFKDIDEPIEHLIKKRINDLEEMGAKIEMIDIPTLQHSEYALSITDMSEASTVHDPNLKTRLQDFGEDTRLTLELGEAPTAVDYLQAQQIRHQLKLEFKAAFRKVDVLVAPTLPIMVPEIGTETARLNGQEVDLFDHALRLTSPANFTGLPSLSVPCGLVKGMPVGMQIIGDACKESDIILVGKLIENMKPLEGKAPNVLV